MKHRENYIFAYISPKLLINMAKAYKCYCPKCKQITNHAILQEASEGSEPLDDFFWKETYKLVKCYGCESVSFNTEYFDETTVAFDEFGEEQQVPIQHNYPYEIGDIEIIRRYNMPSNVYNFYTETVSAINEGSFLLAAAGFRAIIEGICLDKGINSRSDNLEKKIDKLQTNGFITKNDRDRLHAVRFLGNQSVHQLEKPTKRQISAVYEIVFSLLNSLYVLDNKVEDVLEQPVKTTEEFIDLLNSNLKNFQINDVKTLKQLKPVDKRILGADIPAFETELIAKINDGSYTRLTIHSQNGGITRYKVIDNS